MSGTTWALIGLGTVVVLGGVYLAQNHKKKGGGGHKYHGDITNPTKVAEDIQGAQKAYQSGAEVVSYFA